MPDATTRSVLLLGLLVVGGPLAIDMYLAVLPAIAADLDASPGAVQATFSAYFVTLGLSQMIYGPWSDAVGRRPPMIAGLVVFAAGSILCALAPSVAVLVAGRVVQAAGAGALMVVTRAVVRDRYTGADATRVMAAIMLVIAVSPMLAPLAGSLLAAALGWRAIFAALALLGLGALALCVLALPETLAVRRPVRLAAMRRDAAMLLHDRTFMVLSLVNGAGMASFFVFLASAAFVYAQTFGLSPAGFSLAFAVNAVGFFAASQGASALGRRIGLARMVRLATMGFAGATVATFLLTAALGPSLPLVTAGLFVANAFLGLVIPTSMVLALEPHGPVAGMASSLGGTIQMVTGGVAVMLAGAVLDGTALSLLGAVACCGVAAAGLAALGARGAAVTA